MRLSVLPLLIAGAGLVSASPLSVMIASTDLSAMRLGHPAAGAAHAQMMNAAAVQPTSGRRMRHLCKGMKDGVTRFFGVFSIGSTTKVVTPVPATIALTHPNLRRPPSEPYSLRPGEPVFKPHGLQIVDDNRGGVVVKMKAEQMLTESGLPDRPMFVMHYPLNHSGSFLQRVHRALMSLGAWEGRAVAFVLGCGIGVLLRMFYVLTVVVFRAVRGGSPSAVELPEGTYHEVVFEDAEAIVVPPPQYTDEKVALAAAEVPATEEQARA